MPLVDSWPIIPTSPYAPSNLKSLPQIGLDLKKSIETQKIEKFDTALVNLKQHEQNQSIIARTSLDIDVNSPHCLNSNEYTTYLHIIDSALGTLLNPNAPSKTKSPSYTKSKYDDMLTSLLHCNPLGISKKLALKNAIIHKNIEKTKSLLNQQNVNAPLDNEGNTALHCVTTNLKNDEKYWNEDPKAQKMIDTIVSNGGNVNCQNNIGRTPLYYAVLNNHPDITKQLLNYNASPYIMDIFNQNSLSIAIQNQQDFRHTTFAAENKTIISRLKSVTPPTHNHNSSAAQKFSWINIFKFWNLFSLWGEKATPSDAPNAAANNILEQNSEKAADHLPKSWFEILYSWLPPSPFDHEQQVESTPSIQVNGDPDPSPYAEYPNYLSSCADYPNYPSTQTGTNPT